MWLNFYQGQSLRMQRKVGGLSQMAPPSDPAATTTTTTTQTKKIESVNQVQQGHSELVKVLMCCEGIRIILISKKLIYESC